MNVHASKHWLDMKFPNSPPPEYSRWGVYASENDDYISWQQQNMSHEQFVQLQHVLYPRAIFAAAYNSARIFGHLQLLRVKTALGFTLSDTEKKLQMVLRIEKAHQLADSVEEDGEDVNGNAAEQKKRLEQEIQEAAERGGAKRDGKPAPAATISGTSSSSSRFPIAIDLKRTLPHTSFADLSVAWKAFLSTLTHTWPQTRQDRHPKGAFFVLGQVEVRGTNGKARCDVQAAYDPREKKFVYVDIAVKHFFEDNQNAKGGP